MSVILNENEIAFAKIRETAIIPTKKLEDAGYDLYANFEEDYFVIEAGKTRPVPTGIAMAFSHKYYVQIEERSSMGKIGIKKSSGVFDSGYRGEYFIMTYNTNEVPFVISKISAEEMPEEFEVQGKSYKKSEVIIYPYTKAICQAVVQVVPVLNEIELTYDELCSIASERGKGGFGSSGK